MGGEVGESRAFLEERISRGSDSKGGARLLRLFGRSKRKNKKDGRCEEEGFSSQLLGDAEKMPLAKFLMIAEENFGGKPSRRVHSNVDGRRLSNNAGWSGKGHSSSPNLVARLMGLEPLPSSSCSAPRKDASLDYYGKFFQPLDLGLKSGDGNMNTLRHGRLKEQVGSGAGSKESKIRRPVPACSRKMEERKLDFTNKRMDLLFPRSNSADLDGLSAEIMELKRQLRERGGLTLKHFQDKGKHETVGALTLKKSSNQVGGHLKAYPNDLNVDAKKPAVAQAFDGRKSKPSTFPQPHGERSTKIACRYNASSGDKMSTPEKKGLSGVQGISKRKDAISRQESLDNYNPPSSIQKGCYQARMGPKSVNVKESKKESISEERCLACERRHGNNNLVKKEDIVNFNLPKQSDDYRYSNDNRTKPILGSCTSNSIIKNVSQNNNSGIKDLKIVSFKSDKCEEEASSYPLSTENKRNISCNDESVSGNSYMSERSEVDLNIGCTPSERIMDLGGDKLGALLEQKILELKSIDQDDTDASDDDAHLGRSSASILEELIYALTNEQTTPIKNMDGYESDLSIVEDECESHNLSNSACRRERTLEMLLEEKSPCGSSEFSLESDCSGPSPVSTLQASFSLKSCMSESMHSGSKSDPVFTEAQQFQTFNNDMNAVDFMAARSEVSNERVSHILESISIMYHTSTCETGDLVKKYSYVREVISNIELLFGYVNSYKSNGMESSLDSLLLDTLEILVDAYQASVCSLICPQLSERFQIRRFIFDCMIEHLDLNYGQFSRSGCRTWAQLSQFQTSEKLSRQVSVDVNKWLSSDGKALNAIISEELSQLPLNQSSFDVELYELGMETGQALCNDMLDETLVDILSF